MSQTLGINPHYAGFTSFHKSPYLFQHSGAFSLEATGFLQTSLSSSFKRMVIWPVLTLESYRTQC